MNKETCEQQSPVEGLTWGELRVNTARLRRERWLISSLSLLTTGTVLMIVTVLTDRVIRETWIWDAPKHFVRDIELGIWFVHFSYVLHLALFGSAAIMTVAGIVGAVILGGCVASGEEGE